MLDTAGQVVGVAVATGDRVGELSFAIPIDRVREVIGALRDYGSVARSAGSACKVKPVTAEQATALGLPTPTGALVTEIEAGSPAARAGAARRRRDPEVGQPRRRSPLAAVARRATPPGKSVADRDRGATARR